MAANVKVLLDNLHECLNIGAVEALPVVLDLQSSVGGCSDHELGWCSKLSLVELN